MEEITKELNEIIYTITTAYRNNEKPLVLQHYDILTASPAVNQLAETALACREEFATLEMSNLKVNVLDPDYLLRRLQPTRNPSAGLPNYQDPLALSPVPPIGEGQRAASVELPPVSELAKKAYELEQRVEVAWGMCLLISVESCPDEEEMHFMIIDTFENIFQRPSDYLRALREESGSAVELLTTYKAKEGSLPNDVIMAALNKHASANSSQLGELLDFLRAHEVPLTIAGAEVIEKQYVKCMKPEGAEEVFEKMLAARFVPMSNRPFAMLFNCKTVKRVKSVLDYYELMLDYGITPEISSLRLLCKQNVADYVHIHFSMIQNNPVIAGGGAATATPNAAGGVSPTPPQETSKRKNERMYFEKRLMETLEENPDLPLLEAMKWIHRAEVEGTTLEGDTLLLNTLLLHCCKGTTPLKDLVHPFSLSLAYQPKKVLLRTEEELEREEMVAANKPVPIGTQGAMPGLSGGANTLGFVEGTFVGELLEDEEAESDGGDDVDSDQSPELGMEPLEPEGMHGGGLHMDNGNGGDQRQGRGPPSRLASLNKEAAYVLRVLSTYGSIPDNKTLDLVSHTVNSRPHGIGVMEQVIISLLSAAEQQRTSEALRINLCHTYVHYLVRRHNRTRVMNFIRSLLDQYYQFTALRNIPWTTGTMDDNDRSIMSIMTATMRSCQLDWAVGVFAIGLCICETFRTELTKSRLVQLREVDMRRGHGKFDIVAEFERCEWDINEILGNADIVCPELIRGNAYEEPGSIYTRENEGMSSRTNQQPLEAKRGLSFYVRFVLREMNMERPVANFYKELLISEHLKAAQILEERRAKAQQV